MKEDKLIKMITTKSTYNEKGDLVSRLTVGASAFPEKLEIEYNEFGLAQQSLYDLITNEDGKEFKKLKLRTDITYDDKGRVSKIVSPESIVTCEYKDEGDYKIQFIEKSFWVKSISHTEYLIKNEDGSEKNNTVCYIVEGSGSISKDDIYDIKYESARVLVTYNLDKTTIKFTEYYLFNDKNNVVYYEKRDNNDEVKEYQVTVFDINTNDINCIDTKDFESNRVTVTYFDNLYEERRKYPSIFSLYPDNTFYKYETTVTDMTTEKELQRTEATYKFEEVEGGNIIVSHEISTNDMENDDAEVYTETEYTFDSDTNLIKMRDNNDHTISYMMYDTCGDLSRMVVVNNETKKITPFSRTGKMNNKTIHLYTVSEFEDKQISTEFVKYLSGYITETTTVTEGGKELCSYTTNNGEDYKVGVLFDTLYTSNIND